jgi:hypothetical protein
MPQSYITDDADEAADAADSFYQPIRHQNESVNRAPERICAIRGFICIICD